MRLFRCLIRYLRTDHTQRNILIPFSIDLIVHDSCPYKRTHKLSKILVHLHSVPSDQNARRFPSVNEAFSFPLFAADPSPAPFAKKASRGQNAMPDSPRNLVLKPRREWTRGCTLRGAYHDWATIDLSTGRTSDDVHLHEVGAATWSNTIPSEPAHLLQSTKAPWPNTAEPAYSATRTEPLSGISVLTSNHFVKCWGSGGRTNSTHLARCAVSVPAALLAKANARMFRVAVTVVLEKREELRQLPGHGDNRISGAPDDRVKVVEGGSVAFSVSLLRARRDMQFFYT